WGRATQEAMVGHLQSFQGISEVRTHSALTPFLFFALTLAINIFVVSKGIAGGIERLARVGMPLLFVLAMVLAVVVLTLPPGPGGETAFTGLQFIYTPNLSRLGDASIWLAAAGQIFFTLSVGMGTLQVYASYLTKRDDLTLSGLATASTNEAVEVVLGGTIAIPAAVVFFGVSGAIAVAQSGSFNLAFAAMPVIFQQLPFGAGLGTMWFSLLFFAGITSSVAMAMPILAFFREEFGLRREPVAWGLGGVALGLGLLHILWLEHGFLDEWDYWAGTFGLVVFATIEVVLFMWVYGRDRAWHSLHQGADLQIPVAFKWIMAFVTPAYLLFILGWWGVTDALPILMMDVAAAGGPVRPKAVPYVLIARLLLVAMTLGFLWLIRLAWKRNQYQEGGGLIEVVPAEVATR
ncbi:MAG TPA: sodium:calcium symporter, partial [Chloroflexota bacterium]|nr:sodium:calcium symporter [Chloroflexota bacterium]